MTRIWLVLVCTLALVVVACGGAGDASPGAESPAAQSPAGPGESPAAESPAAESPAAESPAAESPAAESPAGESPAAESPAAESPGESPAGESPATGECVVEPVDSPDESISGNLRLAGWSAGNVEDELLQCVLDKFEARYPNVTVEFEVIAGEYPAVMANRLGAGDAPDLFYVNQAYSADWVDQGLLMALDQMAADAGFGLDAFYEGYLSPFQRDGQTYAFPKDSSILGMQTNDRLLSDAGVEIPTTIEELVAAAQSLQESGVQTPMCFAPEWQRAGAFVHAHGGAMVDENGAPAIDSDESRAGIQWYLDQYANGLASTAADVGAGWCGEAFGREEVAIAFEGNWIGPYMESDFPDVDYTVSAIPSGPAGQATLSYTVGYGMHPNNSNQEATWALLEYLTGPEGMQEWVNGGLVLPARGDVEPQSERQQTYAQFAEFAHPGEGVTPQWGQVGQAFNGALGGEATGGHSADAVIDATLPVLQSVTGQ